MAGKEALKKEQGCGGGVKGKGSGKANTKGGKTNTNGGDDMGLCIELGEMHGSPGRKNNKGKGKGKRNDKLGTNGGEEGKQDSWKDAAKQKEGGGQHREGSFRWGVNPLKPAQGGANNEKGEREEKGEMGEKTRSWSITNPLSKCQLGAAKHARVSRHPSLSSSSSPSSPSSPPEQVTAGENARAVPAADIRPLPPKKVPRMSMFPPPVRAAAPSGVVSVPTTAQNDMREEPREGKQEMYTDAASGRRYSHNNRTGETVWVDEKHHDGEEEHMCAVSSSSEEMGKGADGDPDGESDGESDGDSPQPRALSTDAVRVHGLDRAGSIDV